MNNTKVYIVEDEAVAMLALERMLTRNNAKVVGLNASAEQAWQDLQHIEADVLLLDIRLAGLKNGIWLAAQIREKRDMPIVYLTAHVDAETRLEVLQTKPNGYLTKPYDEASLLTTIAIAIDSFKQVNQAAQAPEPTEIYVKHKNTLVKIKEEDIHFLKSEGNYVQLVVNNHVYLVRDKMDTFLLGLPNKEQFIRTHLRYAVNKHFITAFKKSSLFINNEIEIPISKSYRLSVKAHLEKFY